MLGRLPSTAELADSGVRLMAAGSARRAVMIWQQWLGDWLDII